MTADIFKSIASAAEHQARVEKYKIENAKFLKSEKCQRQLHPPLPEPKIPDEQWDHDQARAEGWGNMVDRDQLS
jgi:hypothetical protein